MPDETPSQLVYNNSLVFSNILEHLCSKADVLSCRVTSKGAFALAMKALYDEVEENTLTRVLAKRCALDRLQTYGLAVRKVKLRCPTFPNNIDIASLRAVYRNLTHIRFCLPLDLDGDVGEEGIERQNHNAVSCLHIIAQPEKTTDGDAEEAQSSERTGEALRDGDVAEDRSGRSAGPLSGSEELWGGELDLVIWYEPEWEDIHLGSREFALLKKHRRFTLVSLTLGRPMPFDRPFVLPPEWAGLDGIVDVRDDGLMRDICRDLRRLDSRCCLDAPAACRLVEDTPNLLDLLLILENNSLPSGEWADDNIIHFLKTRNVILDSCVIVPPDCGLSHIPKPGETYHAGARRSYGVSCVVAGDQLAWESGIFLGELKLFPRAGAAEFEKQPFQLILLADAPCSLINPFTIARSLVQYWPPHFEIDIAPYFHRPDAEFALWRRNVLATRCQLIRALSGNPGRGYKLVKKSEKGSSSVEEG